MHRRILLAVLAALPLVAGCATTKPKPETSAQTAFVEPKRVKTLDADDPVPMSPERWAGPRRGLKGRTLTVASLGDIRVK